MNSSRRGFLAASSLCALAPLSGVASENDDPLGVRKDFPAVRDYTYLNTAYIGLTPQPVVNAAREWVEARALHTYTVGQMEQKKRETRELFAKLVGADTDEIGFLFSTSEGENVVVNSLDFQPGDNVVFDDLVYPSTPVIYRRLQETHGVEMRIVKNRNGAATVEDFAKLVDQRTRIVSVAWVSNTSGHLKDIQGLADLAHAHGAYLYSDAAQFIGTAPVDVHALGIDFFTTGTYKWIMAGFGIAPFYVRRDLLERIHAPNVGWMVEKSLPDYHYQHYQNARKFEFSSPSYGQFFDLAPALQYLQRVGLDKIEAQCVGLAQQLRQGLAQRGFRVFTPEGNRSPIVSFWVKGAQKDVQAILDAERIKVSYHDESEETGKAEVRVRVSPAFFNNAAEIRRMLDVSKKLAS